MDANTLQTVLANLISKYGEGAAKHGPDAVGLLIRYLHYMAIMTLCLSALDSRMVLVQIAQAAD